MDNKDNVLDNMLLDNLYDYPVKITLRNNKVINAIYTSKSRYTLDVLNELVDQKSNTFKLLITLRKFRPMLINVFDIQRVELHKTFYSRCI